jgi:TolB-like protein/DNA-binding winged helix-turn-helix (wHTH) protein/Flp pilus assembly protein TadD
MRLPGQAPNTFRFGHFVVDEDSRTVTRHGLPAKVRGQSFDVLLALLNQPGQVVKRQDLRNLLWPDGTHVEFETGLNSIVNRLRQALGDTAARTKYIQTIPRLGYRFVGHLLEAPLDLTRAPGLRLVVLPFANLSGDPQQEYLCDGLTEELIGQLATLGAGRLSVIARTSSMHYKGTRKSLAAISRELRANYVLEGSLRRSGQRVRVSAQLIETSGQTHVWANTYEGELGDLLRFQEAVGLAVAREIRCATSSGPAPVVKQPAYDAYLRGRFQAGRFSACGLSGAVEHFEEAVSLEPDFARAWAMLAQVWAESGFWNHAPAAVAYPKADYAAGRALSLDETLADAHRALGTVHWFHHWDLHSCRREFLRAVELKPSDAAAHLSLATYLASMESDFPHAIAEGERARELDPLSALIWGNTGWIYLWARDYAQAITISRHAIGLDAQDPSAYYVLGLAFAGLGRWSESIQVLENGSRLQCGNMMLGYLATSCANFGDRSRALQILADLECRSQTQSVLPTSFAFVQMSLGNHEIALDWLEKAYAQRDPHTLWLRTAPRWDPIRGYPRFARLLDLLPRPPNCTL